MTIPASITGFDFDAEIDRTLVPALKHHPNVLGVDGGSLFAAGVADMDFKAPPVVLDALQVRLDHGVFGYEALPDGLIPALTGWFETRHGWRIDPDWILRAPNVLDSLAIAASLFTEPGDSIIIQPPVFFDFKDVIRENGRTVIDNPLLLHEGRYEMDFEGLERLCADPRARMLFLCNPHNPVGRVWTRAELTRLSEICLRHGVLVVSDEIHGDLAFPRHPYTPYASLGGNAARNSVICLSPAKSFNIPSCSAAFTIIPDEARRAVFQAENSRLTVNKNNAFANAAMMAAYRDGEPWLDAVLAYLADNLALVRGRLETIPGVRLIEPEATFLLWIDFRDLVIAAENLHDFLRQKASWAATRGLAFGAQGAGFARVNIACPRARLHTALDQLAAAVSSLRPRS